MVLSLKRVWETVELSDDLKSESSDWSKFAAEFFSVLQGKAAKVYVESDLFLKKTFLTNNMRYIITQILNRLSNGQGEPVLILSTEFGGGKTHTILLAYHILKNRDKGFEYIKNHEIAKDVGISSLPEADICSN